MANEAQSHGGLVRSMIFRPLKGPGNLHNQPVLKGCVRLNNHFSMVRIWFIIIQLKQPFIEMDGLQVPERLENLQVKQS